MAVLPEAHKIAVDSLYMGLHSYYSPKRRYYNKKMKMKRGVIVFAAIIMVTMTIPAVMGDLTGLEGVTADPGGPYSGPAGIPIQFDGSNSFVLPPGFMITSYEWDFGDENITNTPYPIITHTYTSVGVYTVTLTVTDNFDYSATETTTATIEEISQPTNQPPIADANNPYVGVEGSEITFDASASTDPDNDPLQYRWDFDSDGTWDTDWLETPTASYTWSDDWSGAVMVEVSDGELTDTETATVTVSNVAPTVEAGADQTVDEGSSMSFSGSFTDPCAEDTHTIEWNFGDGSFSSELNPTHDYDDNGVYTVTLTVTDDDGGVGTDTLTVTVNNVAPTINESSFIGPMDPVQVGTEISVSAAFTDPGILDIHTAKWDCGDGVTSAGTVDETDGSGTVSGFYTYTQAGVYTITLTVTDNDGGSDSAQYQQYIVVYDPDCGFVTGGGWITSPEGAYIPDPTLTGKATFGFVSKYKKGATVPIGQTEFQFHAGDLNFHSTSYDWLVIAGAKAKYKGTGTINGAGNYGFMLTAIDEKLTPSTDVDMFRIKIWNKDDNDGVVYDNQIDAPDDADPATALGRGSIVIHKSKKK